MHKRLAVKVMSTTIADLFDFIVIGSKIEHKSHRSDSQSKGANIITVEIVPIRK